jgi:hypothetical protein
MAYSHLMDASNAPVSDADGLAPAPAARPAGGWRRTALLGSVSVLAGAALLATGAWISRKPLLEAAIGRALAGRGVPASVTVTRLDADGAGLSAIRIGKEGGETLSVGSARLDWGWSFRRGRLELQVSDVEAVRVNLALGPDGLDLGALAPLLEPTDDGPSPVFVDAIDIRQARIDLATPEGLFIAHADVRGAQDRLAVAGRITLPASATGAAGPQVLPVWLALRQKSGPDRTIIGLHAAPGGLDFRRGEAGGFAGLSGRLNGAAVFFRGGPARFEIQPSLLEAASISAAGITAGGAAIRINRGDITPGTDPARTLAASLDASVSATRPAMAAVEAGRLAGRLTLGRTSGGETRLTWDGAARQVRLAEGPVRQVGEVTTRLSATGLLPDLAAPDALTGTGRIDVSARDARLAQAVIDGMPQPWSVWLNAPATAVTTLAVALNPSRVAVSLAAPLQARLPAGTVTFVPSSGQDSTLVLEARLDEPAGPVRWTTTAGASGQLQGRLGDARIDARINTAGFAGGRIFAELGEAVWTGLPVDGLITSGTIEEARVSAIGDQITGQARGQVRATGTLPDGTRVQQLQARFDGGGNTSAWQATGTVQAAGLALPAGESVEGLNARFDATGGSGRWRLAARGLTARAVSPAASVAGLDFDLALAGQGGVTDIRGRGSMRSLQAGTTALSQVAFTATGVSNSSALFAGDVAATTARVSGPELQGRDVAFRGPVEITRASDGATRVDFDLTADGTALAAGPVSAASARIATKGGVSVSGSSVQGSFNLTGTAGGVRQAESVARSVRFDTRLGIQGSDGRYSLSSLSGCIPAILDGVRAGGGTVNTVNVDICPQEGRPLLAFGGGAPRLAADAAISPINLVLDANPDLPEGLRQSLQLGPSRLVVVDRPDGPRYALTATSLTYALPLEAAAAPGVPAGTAAEPPQATGRLATISSNDARLEIIPVANGFRLEGTLSGLVSEGLPVSASGTATASLLASDAGLTGSFDLTGITISDPQADPAFGTMTLNGSGLLQPDRVTIDGALNEVRTGRMVASLSLEHVLSQASGSVTATINRLDFDPRLGPGGIAGLQPDDLSPRLRGLITSARGTVSGTVRAGWASGQPLATAATIAMERFSFASGAGTITNLNGTVALDDLLTQRTAGVQSLRIGEFNPGVPLESGEIRFALPGNGSLQVESAIWPFSGGRLLVDPTVLVFSEASQAFNVRVDGINLDSFLQLTGIRQLEVSGTASGVFPMVLTGNSAAIRGGYLEADSGGGLLRYTGPDPSPPPPPPTWWQRLTRQSPPPPQGLGLAIAALRNLDYRVLRLTVDGPLTGDIDVGVTISGSNRDVLGGAPFAFNVVTDVPLAQLLSLRRYLDPQWYTDQALEQQRLEQQRRRLQQQQQ